MITVTDIIPQANFISYQVPRSLRLRLVIDKIDKEKIIYHTVSMIGVISASMEDTIEDLLSELNNLKFSIVEYENWDI